VHLQVVWESQTLILLRWEHRVGELAGRHDSKAKPKP
jgi:hypothetical protein